MKGIVMKSIKQNIAVIVIVLVLTSLFITGQDLQAQVKGSITGSVTEVGTKRGLYGANVQIEGTYIGTATDNRGYYYLPNVMPGSYNLVVSYIGYEKVVKPVTVEPRKIVTVDFEMLSTVVSGEEVIVTAEREAQSQARALNTQRDSRNIKSVVAADLSGRFPDANVVEAMSRVPGIAISRDQGEGRYPIIRGLETEYTSTTINGERLPNSEDAIRSTAMDVIPADLIEAITVSKALTADQEADAIAGQVDLQLKSAPIRRILNISASYGFNEKPGLDFGVSNSQARDRIALTYGDSYFDGKIGFIGTVSHYKSLMSTDEFVNIWEWDDEDLYGRPGLPDGLRRYRERDYEITRERIGFSGNVAYMPSVGHKFYFNGMVTNFMDLETRNLYAIRYDSEKYRKAGKYRLEDTWLMSYTLGGDHIFQNKWNLDYHFTYGMNRQDRGPERYQEWFRDWDSTEGYEFTEVEIDEGTYKEWDNTGAVNLKVPFIAAHVWGNLKVGAKYRERKRDYWQRWWLLEPADGEDPWYLPGGPNTTAYPDIFFDPPINLVFEDITEDANVYTVNEKILALYAQTEIWYANKLMFLPGIRMEQTKTKYSTRAGFEDPGTTYTHWFPQVHLTYKVNENTNIRLARTQGIRRPDYQTLIPYEMVDDDEVERGNPELKPAIGTNYDLMFETFFGRLIGFASVGLFYKTIDDIAEVITTREGNFEVTQPHNVGDAYVKGIEFAFGNRLDFIGLKNFNIWSSYVLSDAEIRNLVSRPDRNMLGHSKHVLNVALGYENPKIGFSGQVAYQFLSRNQEGVSDDPDGVYDTFYDDYSRVDVKLFQRIFSGVKLFIEGLNLTDAPQARMEVTPFDYEVRKDKDYFGRSFMAGFIFNLM